MNPRTEILTAIGKYAEAHAELDALQWKYKQVFPRNDQKTGAIGEFYAMQYARSLYPDAEITFGEINNPGWDIEVLYQDKPTHIQVKTTSAFAKYKQLSPIHYGWDELYVLHLDKQLKPDGFWIIRDGKQVLLPEKKYTTCKAPRLDQMTKKSGPLLFMENQIAQLRQAVPVLF